MCMERWIRLIAGTFIIISLVLAKFVSPYWLLFTLFVGLNLFQSALTKWCLMENILAKFGVPPCAHAGSAAGTPGTRA
jgi:hypothetical protein